MAYSASKTPIVRSCPSTQVATSLAKMASACAVILAPKIPIAPQVLSAPTAGSVPLPRPDSQAALHRDFAPTGGFVLTCPPLPTLYCFSFCNITKGGPSVPFCSPSPTNANFLFTRSQPKQAMMNLIRCVPTLLRFYHPRTTVFTGSVHRAPPPEGRGLHTEDSMTHRSICCFFASESLQSSRTALFIWRIV